MREGEERVRKRKEGENKRREEEKWYQSSKKSEGETKDKTVNMQHTYSTCVCE